MAYETYQRTDNDERTYLAYLMNLFSEVRNRRANFEPLWEEAASLCWPEYRNSFSFGSVRAPGMKYTEFQLDTSASIASHRFMAVCDALMTPFSMPWARMRASDSDLMKDRNVKLYYERVTEIMWQERYKAEANFMGSQQVNWQSVGVFGGQNMLTDELDISVGGGQERGLRYIPCPPGEIYLLRNHQGRVDGFIRHFRWNARQAYQKWPEIVKEKFKSALDRNSQELFDFLQFVMPRTDYKPEAILTPQSKPYSSCYISCAPACILEEGGYRTFPLAHGGYMLAPGEEYERGPAQQVLPALKTLNAEKALFLKAGQYAADPMKLLPGDDSLFDFKAHPGSYVYGGITEDGKPLVANLAGGDIQITLEMMQEERRCVDDAFLVSLYAFLFGDAKNSRARNAREVIEYLNDRALFLAPTLGKQFGYLAGVVSREYDVLSYQRKFPPKPPALREAQGQYTDVAQWTSPLALALRGPAAAGFLRTVEIAAATVQAGGPPDVMDIFDFEVALPEIAEDQFTPTRWMSTPQKIAATRQGRAKQQQQENYIKSLPGLAAKAKADAISQKAQAGMNIGGVLSGTPEGGMPMMPGQSEPGGRPF